MKDTENNIVYVGKKGTPAYILALQKQAKINDLIFIKARGRYIAKAAAVALRAIKKHLDGFKIKDVELGNEPNYDVPVITISLVRE